MEETMSYQETFDQLYWFAPVEAFRHHLSTRDPDLIAKDIWENWEYCKEYHKTEEWLTLDRRAVEAYAEKLAEELKDLAD